MATRATRAHPQAFSNFYSPVERHRTPGTARKATGGRSRRARAGSVAGDVAGGDDSAADSVAAAAIAAEAVASTSAADSAAGSGGGSADDPSAVGAGGGDAAPVQASPADDGQLYTAARRSYTSATAATSMRTPLAASGRFDIAGEVPRTPLDARGVGTPHITFDKPLRIAPPAWWRVLLSFLARSAERVPWMHLGIAVMVLAVLAGPRRTVDTLYCFTPDNLSHSMTQWIDVVKTQHLPPPEPTLGWTPWTRPAVAPRSGRAGSSPASDTLRQLIVEMESGDFDEALAGSDGEGEGDGEGDEANATAADGTSLSGAHAGRNATSAAAGFRGHLTAVLGALVEAHEDSVARVETLLQELERGKEQLAAARAEVDAAVAARVATAAESESRASAAATEALIQRITAAEHATSGHTASLTFLQTEATGLRSDVDKLRAYHDIETPVSVRINAVVDQLRAEAAVSAGTVHDLAAKVQTFAAAQSNASDGAAARVAALETTAVVTGSTVNTIVAQLQTLQTTVSALLNATEEGMPVQAAALDGIWQRLEAVEANTTTLFSLVSSADDRLESLRRTLTAVNASLYANAGDTTEDGVDGPAPVPVFLGHAIAEAVAQARIAAAADAADATAAADAALAATLRDELSAAEERLTRVLNDTVMAAESSATAALVAAVANTSASEATAQAIGAAALSMEAQVAAVKKEVADVMAELAHVVAHGDEVAAALETTEQVVLHTAGASASALRHWRDLRAVLHSQLRRGNSTAPAPRTTTPADAADDAFIAAVLATVNSGSPAVAAAAADEPAQLGIVGPTSRLARFAKWWRWRREGAAGGHHGPRLRAGHVDGEEQAGGDATATATAPHASPSPLAAVGTAAAADSATTTMTSLLELLDRAVPAAPSATASRARPAPGSPLSPHQAVIEAALLALAQPPAAQAVDAAVSAALARPSVALPSGAGAGSAVGATSALVTATSAVTSTRAADGSVTGGYLRHLAAPAPVSSQLAKIGDVVDVVNAALAAYAADTVGRADFAAASAGACVVLNATSRTWQPPTSPLVPLLGKTGNGSEAEALAADVAAFAVGSRDVLIKHFAAMRGLSAALLATIATQTPQAALEPSLAPGHCWPMAGSSGSLTVQLAQPIHITAVTIDHPVGAVLHDASRASALKAFAVYGVALTPATGTATRTLLGRFVYRADGPQTQTFAMEHGEAATFAFVELRVDGNHGHSDFTCIYRFRVHGQPAAAAGGAAVAGTVSTGPAFGFTTHVPPEAAHAPPV